MEYFPSGEIFVENHKNDGLNSQYKFNGKEQDGETGYYYYGARYYNPRVSLWLNVDPLADYNPFYNTEHYIDGQHNGGVYNSGNLNPYIYCYQSPVLFVDPNGKQNVTSAISLMGETNYRSNNIKYYRPSVNVVNSSMGVKDLTSTLQKLSGAKKIKYEVTVVKTIFGIKYGEDKLIKTKLIATKSISFLALFSHGVPGRIFGDGKSITMDDISTLGNAVKSGSIKFSKNAIIFLGACNAYTDAGNGKSFAEELAIATGRPVIGMKDDGVAPTQETTGKSNNPTFEYGPKMGEGSFYQVNPDGTSKSLGKKVELIKLIDARK